MQLVLRSRITKELIPKYQGFYLGECLRSKLIATTVLFINILRVFEKRVLKRIFGTKRGQVAMDWRRLHNEELRDLYASECMRLLLYCDLHEVEVFKDKQIHNFSSMVCAMVRAKNNVFRPVM
jgi:hypothetical protein